MNLQIKLLDTDKIPALSEFARPIWLEHFSSIVGEAQVNYMLDKFQSEEAIHSQIKQGFTYYQVLLENQLVGYFSIQIKENSTLFISKFYLIKNARGKNLGVSMLKHIKMIAFEQGCNRLELTVNKQNPAVNIYLKLGFINIDSIQIDIGEGYVMDDYLMQKDLSDELKPN